jgi:serine/threonine-protein kinase HipA
MELLAQVGHDLPGAVRIVLEDGAPDSEAWDPEALKHEQTRADSGDGRVLGWRFSLAGVGLKFSMLRQNDRLALPAFGEGGDWIVKLPDATYVDVPRNEHAMMTLAASVGIEVPEHTLVRRGDLEGLPEHVWLGSEELAYAVRRFDRGENRTPIHIEDFAQVRNFYPHAGQKYQGSFETVAALVYRRRDLEGLYEFVRRLTFNILISNGDAHLKNWSLIYHDPRIPTLSPVYDLVSTAFYQTGDSPEDLGLRFDRTRRFDQVKVDGFARLEKKLGVIGADLAGCALHTIERVVAAWPAVAGLLDANPRLRDSVAQSIQQRRRTLLRSV